MEAIVMDAPRQTRLLAPFLAVVLALTAGAATAVPAAAEDPVPTTAAALATAMAVDPGIVKGASFVAIPAGGRSTLVGTTAVAGFPKHGGTYAVLSSGDANAIQTGATPDSNLGGANVRGSSDFDVTVLRVDIAVPAGANCMTGVDFRFLSKEYPGYIGSHFNDAFILEIDRSTWTTDASTISSPGNIAFDEFDNELSINAAGAATMRASLATGTPYGGSSRTLTARAPLTPGSHSLFFSIFDQGDHDLDSAVLLDRLRVGTVANLADCQPGVTVVPGATVSAAAPTFDEAASTVTIPSTQGVVYAVNGVTAPAGKSAGWGTMVVTAAATGDTELTGPSQWAHKFGKGLTPVTPLSPTVNDQPGTDNDTVTIPALTGVKYRLEGTDVLAGPHSVVHTASVSAYATAGYVLNGPSGWTFPLGGGATITPPAPTANVAAATFTIPSAGGVKYFVGDDEQAAGPHAGSGTVTVEATPSTATPLRGATTWSLVISQDDAALTVVTPKAPSFTDLTGGGTVTIPTTTGVSYAIDGAPVAAGARSASGFVSVTATAKAGYALEGITGWSRTFAVPPRTAVTPTAITFTDPAGMDLDSYTVPTQLGVRYVLGGDLVLAGTYPADLANPKVTITALATAGFTLSGTSSWSHTFTDALPAVVNLTVPTISGTAKVGSVLKSSTGTWNPTGISVSYRWLRAGAPIASATAATYSPTAADVGKAVSVRVTASRTGMQSASATSATLKVAAGSAPTASVLPNITGTARVGHTLAASRGTWSGSGWTFSYQWLRGTKAIAAATGATYKLKAVDAGAKVAVRVSATKSGYGTGVATSASRSVARLASTIRGSIVRTTITTRASARVVAVVKVAGIVSPTGKVRVYYGSRSITKALGTNGKVTVTLPRLAKGRYTIKVRYLGSTHALPSTIVTIGSLRVV
jgi:hypothetical protein